MKQERIFTTILSAHLSEKATLATQNYRQYVFEVCSKSTKQTVKDAIEHLFKSKVKTIRILNVKTKPKRFGNRMGRSKAWKKAYVTLLEGEQINLSGNQ